MCLDFQKCLGKGSVPCQGCFKSTIRRHRLGNTFHHSLKLWMFPANSATPWSWLNWTELSLASCQRTGTDGKHLESRRLAKLQWAQGRRKEASWSTNYRPRIIHSFISSMNTCCMLHCARHCAGPRHLSKQVTPVSWLWLWRFTDTSLWTGPNQECRSGMGWEVGMKDSQIPDWERILSLDLRIRVQRLVLKKEDL